jgi:uncharacterized protein (DUF1499 family)
MKTILVYSLFSLFLIQCSGTRPGDLGIRSGKLKDCPNKPNCVQSQMAPDDSHFISPITYTSPRSDEQKRLKSLLQTIPRTSLVKEEDGYLYYEFTSLLMRYVDDVEFYLDDTTKLIHVRSASRLGHSDLGVNKKRVESIRTSLLKAR